MCSRVAFVYSASTVNTMQSKCWWHITSRSDGPDIRRESRVVIDHLQWMPPLILIVYSRLDSGIQSAMEMLPLKSGGEDVAHSCNSSPPRTPCICQICILLMHLLFVLLLTKIVEVPPHRVNKKHWEHLMQLLGMTPHVSLICQNPVS